MRYNQIISRQHHQNYFYNHLYASIEVSGALGWFHKLTHRNLERGLGKASSQTVLEIGVNKGEHLPFVRHHFDLYVASDLRVSPEETFGNQRQVARIACSGELLPFQTNSFDRVIMTCVLHHLPHPLDALAEMRRVTQTNGLISILLPCDPGVAYRASWSLTSRRRLHRIGVSTPELYHALEHPGHFSALHAFAMQVFKADHVRTRWWPLRISSWNLNVFTVLSVRVNKPEV